MTACFVIATGQTAAATAIVLYHELRMQVADHEAELAHNPGAYYRVGRYAESEAAGRTLVVAGYVLAHATH